MKRLYSITIAGALLLLFSLGTFAQAAKTSPSGLNQVDLLKQFIGTWKNESIKDTVYTAEFKPYGNGGLEFTLKSVTQGKQWLEMKQLWGYDKKNNKVVIAGLMKDSPNIMLQSALFTAKDRFEQVPLEFAADPGKAGFVVVFRIKSPDLVLREEIVNGKSLGIETYTREKN